MLAIANLIALGAVIAGLVYLDIRQSRLFMRLAEVEAALSGFTPLTANAKSDVDSPQPRA